MNKLNAQNTQITGTDFDKASLEEIIKSSTGEVFNNSDQVWKHSFYWNCLSPQGGGTPSGDVLKAIENNFGSFKQFKQDFSAYAMAQFGSGWA